MPAVYGVFVEKAEAFDDDYRPETVNTDAWQPTQQAWQVYFQAFLSSSVFSMPSSSYASA
jgi:hypothetical protein